MTQTPAIQVEKLTRTYGSVLAVDNVTFTVQPGELVGFLGPNGAGKSTTMRILTTYLPASSGVAKVCGHDVMSESLEVRSKIGYLPESVPIYGEMRVEEYLHYRARLKGVPRANRQSRVDQGIERCRIREVRRRQVGTLSKGYRQRVGLADAMIHDPAVLILDEPTSGLDPIQIRETLNTIKDLAGTHTVLLSTHILAEVEAICDRVIIINRGTIRWDGKLTELAKQTPRLLVEVRGPVEAIQSWLKQESGVEQVFCRNIEGDLHEIEIETNSKTDLRESLAQRMIQKGWVLRRLDLRRQHLDDLYMEVVRGGVLAG
jgi:ABC-2 type transport system ATP-binding protein